MDPNNNPFNTQNSTNFPFNYPNPNSYQSQSQSSDQPQNIQNYGFTPNFFMPSAVPNYRLYYGSMMPYPSQTTPFSSFPRGNENVPNVGVSEFPEFSTQIALGGMSGINEANPDAEDSAPARQKRPKWTTAQNLVLIGGWIKFGTNSVVGKNQKSEAYWGKIADYCNEHCAFDPPRDGTSCRNRFNYINRRLGKWVGAYDKAKREKQSGWSENDVLARAHELYSGDKNEHFILMEEWTAIRDQPRYCSVVGVNTGSESSGSKRSRENDASDSNSVGSSIRPTGRDEAKKKAKKKGRATALETYNENLNKFQKCKEQEIEKLENIARLQDERLAETNRVMQEKTQAKKMKMWLKLSEKEHLNEQQKEIFKKLGEELFGK